MKVTTEKGFREKIRAACRGVGAYREKFEKAGLTALLGCGFDPGAAPGVELGHFGLQGVAERAEHFNGEMKIDSTPGKGTCVTVVLSLKT